MLVIGIITRLGSSNEGHKVNVVYNEISNAIKKNGGEPIGLILEDDYKELIDFCDGIIFQGGDNFEKYDLKALKYIYDINKPVLGICLGMQLMGVLFDGYMIDIENHKNNFQYSHEINIENDSKLYNILKKDKIKVNSRHKSVIKHTNLKTSALSDDGYLEALESPNKKFFIGVQWHPESMIDYDDDQNNLFKYFIDCCKIK